MLVQIETPDLNPPYKHANMPVKKKSALIDPALIALGGRIRSVREAKGLNQRKFGEIFGVTQGAVSFWEHGEDRPGHKVLARLASITADDDLRDYFIRESGISEVINASRVSTIEDAKIIRLLRDAAAAGTPRAVDEREVQEMLPLPRSWFRRTGELIAVRIAGDSMAPIINDGYIVIIDTSQRQPKKLVERMVAAREDDSVTIKWLRRDGDTYLLVPQHVSPRHPVRIMQRDGDFSIVGEVIKWIGEPSSSKK